MSHGDPAPTAAPPPMPGLPVTRLGEAALSVQTPHAQALLADLERRPLRGVQEAVPALNVLTVLFDPLQITADEVHRGLAARLADLSPAAGHSRRTYVLPVTFGGPDLEWCAGHAGLSVPAFVDALCAAPLEVAFLGFTPGFGFLTGLPPTLQMPRLDTPRERVPAGSVALGGPWAGLYPRETPGGWRIVGRCDAVLFDLNRPDSVLWRSGDRVRLERA